MKKLVGKTAIITGGNSGIGLETAKLFVAEGARVIITGRRREVVDAAVAEIGPGAFGVTGDVANMDDLDQLTSEAEKRFGRLDIYFANAGINQLTPFGNVSEELFDRQFGINVKAVFFGVQKALPILNDGASVILTGSIASTRALAAHNVYAGTKAALRAFARNWALDLKDRGIRVNMLSPGPVKTPIVTKMGLSEAQSALLDEAVAKQIPMGRWGQPEELAKAALFLASDDSSFVTGIDLCVDGGMGQV
jgi:NAD(P)-dependent dehydrogenase (short-subunit alcohol dehydrogenase family)